MANVKSATLFPELSPCFLEDFVGHMGFVHWLKSVAKSGHIGWEEAYQQLRVRCQSRQPATGYWLVIPVPFHPMHELGERLLRTIRKHEFLRAGDRVAVGVSGGADSVALLLLLAELRRELGIVLSIAHVNHKLRGLESDQDEQFVATLAAKQGLEFVARAAPVELRNAAGVESAARQLRYGFFQELVRTGRATVIATAHTLDDQAETVLLRMFRGAGIRGLAGILPRLQLENEGRVCGEVVRPLLAFRRAELRDYLHARGQSWREDSSNRDSTFLRNRVRQLLMPVIIKEFGEAAVEHIAELAEIARAEEEYWSSFSGERREPVSRVDLGPASDATTALDVAQLRVLPLAAARRTVRAWIETNAPETSISFRLIADIVDLARGETGRKVNLPRAAIGSGVGPDADSTNVPANIAQSNAACSRIVRRSRNELVLEILADHAENYEYELAIPGEIPIPELGVRIAAELVDLAEVSEKDRQQLLDAARLGTGILIRNWRAGDRFWPAQTKQEKKVKELLSDRHVIGNEKKLWPVAVCRGELGQSELVWMRGFAVPKRWQVRSGKAIWIREIGGATA